VRVPGRSGAQEGGRMTTPVTEAATVTDERRCLGVNQDGTPCGTGSELIMPSGYCFAHDPHRALDRKTASVLGGIKSGATKRKGLDPDQLGALETAADAKRWTVLVARSVATGALSAEQGRTVLAAVTEWRKAYEAGELE